MKGRSFGRELSLYTLNSLSALSKNHRALLLKITFDDLTTANVIGSSFNFVESQDLKATRVVNAFGIQSEWITFSWPIPMISDCPFAQDEAHGRLGAG